MGTHIPSHPPTTQLLDQVTTPKALKQLHEAQLLQLADELRQFLMYTVGQTGGHFGAGLGVVELTVALHYVFNTPDDALIWDVGHQSYPHKILTERRDQMATLRRWGGLAPFPSRAESAFDSFGTGHSSTSISAGVGMAIAHQAQGHSNQVIAIIGDGAMTAGQAFEAINHAVEANVNILIVFNDNGMSISPNVGGLSSYFSDFFRKRWFQSESSTDSQSIDEPSPQTLYESLGIHYHGPIDGHDLSTLIPTLKTLKAQTGPKLLHIRTQKGKGFQPAEADPVKYHALDKIQPAGKPVATGKKYSEVFSDWIINRAKQDSQLHAITPAMSVGSGLSQFAKRWPTRYHDVGIAEQHAVTLAAGMACQGIKPVVAIYSTFLQRGYDQFIHDVAVQNLDVTFAVDRAGLVGEDGPTHWGAFDIAYARCIPNMIIATPANEDECFHLLSACYEHPGPAIVRYPRGTGPGTAINPKAPPVAIGQSHTVCSGQSVLMLNFGPYLPICEQIATTHHYTLINMRFAKPLDTVALSTQLAKHDAIVTVEDCTVAGGAGSAVLEWMASEGFALPVLTIGIPDHFIEHASQSEQREQCGLDKDGMELRIRTFLSKCNPRTRSPE